PIVAAALFRPRNGDTLMLPLQADGPFGNARKRTLQRLALLGSHFDRLPGRQPAQTLPRRGIAVVCPSRLDAASTAASSAIVFRMTSYLRSLATRRNALAHSSTFSKYVIAKYTTP